MGGTRLSLTLPVLNHAREVLVLIAGVDKAETLRRVLHEPDAGLPIQRIAPRGALRFLIDRAAAGALA